MSRETYAPPQFPPPRELIDTLVARVLEALAPALPLSPDELRARVSPAVEEVLTGHVAAVEQRLLLAERLANAGQLAAGVAHELRNPLSVIETSAFILGDLLPEDARARRHLRRITEQVTVATGIINDLLEAARERPTARTPVDLVDTVRDAVAQVPRPAGIALDLALPTVLPPALGDARRLRQVLGNLLTNAYQALGATGRVHVTAHATDDEVVVAVRDHGPGIPEEYLDKLFEPLFSTRQHGVGLGLAISKRIVEDHAGALTAENAEGGGARFSVRLPLRRAP